MTSIDRLKSVVGPGLLMAAAAIGVSHLVQSTRAGASFGFELISVILLINLLKYPFFEYGHRFYAVTNKTLLQGYMDLGKPFLGLFLALNLVTAMASVAAVTFVTAALCQNFFGVDLGLTPWSAIIIAACLGLLGLGQYKGLDNFIKILMVVLLVTTVAAVATSLSGYTPQVAPPNSTAFQWANLGFLLALMGWMPAPIELSVWQSLWMEAAEKERGEKISLKEALFDFHLGYVFTVILAIGFCTLGATVMYGSGESFSDAPAAFAGQVVSLYTQNLGEWSWPIISAAAFVTMFSTTITLIDAYPRSLAEGTQLLFSLNVNEKHWLRLWTLVNTVIGLIIIWWFRQHLKVMVDLVTILAFLAGPIFAALNLKLILSDQIPKKHKPSKAMLVLSFTGIVLMLGLSIIFIWNRF